MIFIISMHNIRINNFYIKIIHNYITIVHEGDRFMEVCPSTILNSDASENVAYNNPDFPAYIKKGQLSNYPDFRAVSHWHDDLEFILILEGQMSYDVNGQKISLQTGEGIFVNSRW
jgi:AraC family transcriptional regulator, melibiose operon regulatory protein